MPADLKEAFASTFGPFADNNDTLSSLESLKNPLFQNRMFSRGPNMPDFDTQTVMTNLPSDLHSMSGTSFDMAPGLSAQQVCRSNNGYNGNNTNGLNGINNSNIIGQATSVNNGVHAVDPNRQQPSSSSLPTGKQSCEQYLQHIWSCADCRQKLKELLCDNGAATGTAASGQQTNSAMNIGNLAAPMNLQQFMSTVDLPNLVYYLLLGLFLILVLDYFVRVGRRL